MLVEFRVGNYRSFHHPQTLSLVASNDREHPGNLIAGEKLRLLKSVAVYGANASGKSNLIRAIDFTKRFLRDSATKMNVGDKIDVVPFRLSSGSREQPSLFEVILVLDQVRYQYGFTVTPDRVHDEWLVAYPKGRPQRWYDRRFDTRTHETQWVFRGIMKPHADLLKQRTRDNGLALSRGAELNVAAVIPLFQWFRSSLAAFDLSVIPMRPMLATTAQRLHEDVDFRGRTMRLVQDADLGIKQIRVDRREAPARFSSSSFSSVSSSSSVASSASRRTTGTGFLFSPLGMEMFETMTMLASTPEIRSVHSVSGTDEEQSFDFGEAESKGTQRFFALLGPWQDALRDGCLVVVDELDCSMHPVLTRKLIQLFQDPRENAKGAQLIFATHDTSLMDQSLFRRDQIWLVEKDPNQASRLFSLYDFKDKPRKGEALEKRYLAGRYGGMPVFGPSFEGLGVD